MPKKTNMIPLIDESPEPIFAETLVHIPSDEIGTLSRVVSPHDWKDDAIIEIETKKGPITGPQSDFKEAIGQ